jgi:5-methylcytosine-specific restriction endonuclease McrA
VKGLACEKCGYDGKEYPSLIWVHHRDFKGKTGSNEIDNLEVLCIRCHLEKHLAIGAKWGGGQRAI